MRKILIFLAVLLFILGLVVFPVQAQAQEKKVKKDRWEIEASYGRFWIVKHSLPTTVVKTYNPDFELAFRLRVWRGFYIGIVAGEKKELQNEYSITQLYTNYFPLEDRYSDFLCKDYTRRDLTTLKMAPYIGAEAKLNLFTLKFSRIFGITPFGKIGVKKWFSQSYGFHRTIDYVLYDSGVPYLIYHAEGGYTGNYTYHATETWWHINPDGTKGAVYYSENFSGGMSIAKAGLIFGYGGGLSIRFGSISLNAEIQQEKRKDEVVLDDKVINYRPFRHLMWRAGISYRF
jgi:hypothetical protein